MLLLLCFIEIRGGEAASVIVITVLLELVRLLVLHGVKEDLVLSLVLLLPGCFLEELGLPDVFQPGLTGVTFSALKLQSIQLLLVGLPGMGMLTLCLFLGVVGLEVGVVFLLLGLHGTAFLLRRGAGILVLGDILLWSEGLPGDRSMAMSGRSSSRSSAGMFLRREVF